MIRHYLDLCKFFCKIKHLDEYQIFRHFAKDREWDTDECPYCGAGQGFHRDGRYVRDLICYENEHPVFHEVEIRCIECTCGHSHAVLPSVIIPYSSYSLRFLLMLLYSILTGKYATVDGTCEHFGISTATYYRIYKRFLLDMFELERLSEAVHSLQELFSLDPDRLHYVLRLFYMEKKHSFLQPYGRHGLIIPLVPPPPAVSGYIENSNPGCSGVS